MDRRGRPAFPKGDGVGLRHVALDDGVDFGGLGFHVGVEAGHVDARGLKSLAHLLLRNPDAGNSHQSVMRDVVLALVFGGERHHGAVDRGRADDGPILVDQPDLAVLLDDAVEVGSGFLAIRAVVIEEGNDGEVAFRVARDRRCRIVEDHFLGYVGGGLRERRTVHQRNGQYRATNGEHGAATRKSWHIGSPFGLDTDRSTPARPAIHARHLKAGLRWAPDFHCSVASKGLCA